MLIQLRHSRSMISVRMISPQALSHHHIITKALPHSVRTAHVVAAVAVVVDVVVAVESAETRSTALRR
jgi:hypothetical protein